VGDVQVTDAEVHMQIAAWREFPDVVSRIHEFPIVCGSGGDQQETEDNCFVQRRWVNQRSSGHEAPPGRT
jgi:hypothetical protein